MAARKHRILSDDDAESDGAGTVDAPVASHSRPSRRSKEEAKQKWESLVPGQARKKKLGDLQPEPPSDEDDDDDRSTTHRPKSHKSTPGKATAVHKGTSTSRAKSTRQSTPRAPVIDPHASDDDADEQTQAVGSTSMTQTKRPRTSDDKREAPSQTERGHSTKSHSPSQEQSDSEEGGSYNSSSSESDSEGEKSDEDDELEAMEKNPRALEKKFAEETAYWVEQDASLSPSHRKSRSAAREASSTRSRSLSTHLAPPISRSPSPTSSNEVEHPKSQYRKAHGNDADRPTTSKKRPAREHSDAEDDTTSPPPKKMPKPHGVHRADKERAQKHGTSQSQAAAGKSSVKRKEAPNMQHHASKDTRKRVAAKRQDEIPKFVKPNAVSDTSTNSKRRPEVKEKKSVAPSKSHPKKRTSHALDSDEDSSVEDASGTDSDSEDSGIEIVLPQRGKLKLTDQHRRVRRVVKHSIYTMLVDIGLKNAFPDGPQKQGKIVHRALTSAAGEYGYDDILKRLKKQDEYASALSKIPSQRIPTFRSNVRKLAEGQPCTAFGLMSRDKDKGDWLQEGFRYIYPFDYENKSITAGKPYSPPVFLEILRVAFFKRPSSLGFKICKYFESSLPDKPDEKELPASLLALVATALHAAIEDCKHGHVQPRDFTSNDYWGVYKDHMQELSTIRTRGPVQYHVLMHGFWRQLSSPIGNPGQAGAPRKSFLDVAAMDVD
ncbi:uncharacterized protein TRAVEDRAFT_30250 [Trametes versicolor FP-101664 SS1]|uniref:uncharacterized protein n=1 Tax=Trametes versicolor (strain FP-101664) TaxID=717944 RepID=UPI0004622C75|nr:uncharacterized protein TRAVEDRAFT_30250 [Trametes versicolor FP-101664 SS1]EIW56973.1 hypothetical protein TRAVEDRAFT_30250 [Trametes versicolor FP-101664 SS1]